MIPNRTLPADLPFRSASFEKEWAFLCLCASPGSSPEEIAAACEAVLDWMLVLELAAAHGILGLLAVRFTETGYAGVPGDAREKLQSRLRSQFLFTLGMTAELFRILDDFSKNRIETILVKGPVLSVLAYNDPAVRSFVDLDLLLRDRDIHAATERMIALGFESDVSLQAIRAGKIPGEYLFNRPDTRQMVELHTDRTFRYYPRPMRAEELFARGRLLNFDGREIPALSLEDEFVLNSIHGAKHFWERLMWVADIAAVVARRPEIDWKQVRRAAHDVGADPMVHLALQLAETVLGVRIPAEMAEPVRSDPAAQRLCGQVTRWLPQAGYATPRLKQRALFRMRMRGGGLGGVLYLLRLSLSPTDEDWVEGDREKRFWFFDAVQRPWRLLKKYWS